MFHGRCPLVVFMLMQVVFFVCTIGGLKVFLFVVLSADLFQVVGGPPMMIVYVAWKKQRVLVGEWCRKQLRFQEYPAHTVLSESC